MATLKVKLPDELMIKLERLAGQTGPIIEKTLEAGAKIVEAQVRTNLKNVIGVGTKTKTKKKPSGQLLGALGVSPVKTSLKTDGWDIKIGFSEPRKDGVSNALVATTLEYGKKGQAAKPFMKPARDASRAKVSKVMNEVFTAEAQKIVK